MAVTLEDFAEHLGMPGVPAESEQLERCLGTARAMIAPHILTGTPANEDQTSALDMSVLIVAGDMWRRKDSTGGQFMFSDAQDIPSYIPRDLLNSVWPTLQAAGLVGLGALA